MKHFALLALVLVAATSFASDVAYKSGSKATGLKVGDVLVVTLQALPGAGYVWAATVDKTKKLALSQTKTLPLNGNGVGGKQTMVFRFKALAPGKSTVNFVYGRPWEIKKGGKATKTMAIATLISPNHPTKTTSHSQAKH